MAKRKNERQGGLPLGPRANILLPELRSAHGRKLLKKALKGASAELVGDFKKATFDQIAEKRGVLASVFFSSGFQLDIDQEKRLVVITVDEDDPPEPLTPYHVQSDGLEEDEDRVEEIPEELNEVDQNGGAPADETEPQPEDDKDEDPQAQKGREWRTHYSKLPKDRK